MSALLAVRSRRPAVVSLAAGALACGLLLSPEASASGSSSPTARLAQAAPCEYVNGEATAGQRIGGNPNPPRWKYGNSPSLGAKFDRCGDVVRFYVGGYSKASYYKVSWSVNCPARSFVKNYKTPGRTVVSTITRSAAHCSSMPGDSYNTYEVRVAACNHKPPAADTCTRWSPKVLLTYFTNP